MSLLLIQEMSGIDDKKKKMTLLESFDNDRLNKLNFGRICFFPFLRQLLTFQVTLRVFRALCLGRAPPPTDPFHVHPHLNFPSLI